MRASLLLNLPLLAFCTQWQTIYNSNFTTAYIRSVNGSLYELPISDKDTSTSDVNSALKELSTPPDNSSLVVDSDGHLLAVWGSGSCGSAPVEISQFDHSKNEWSSLAQSNAKTQKWAEEGQIVWLDRSEDKIYLFGGSCKGKTQNGFYSFSLHDNSFEEINSQDSVMPRSMSDAQTIALSDYETLVLGGRTGSAWMSMQQIAVYGYGSWNFGSVSNSSGIDSRENPLLLPVFSYGQNGSKAVDKIIVIGGTVAGRSAKPEICVLHHSESSGWYWGSANTDSLNKRDSDSSDIDVTYAGSTLYSTLANFNQKSNTVELYSTQEKSSSGWQPVQQVKVDKSNKKSSGGGTSSAVIAVVSTLLPVIFLCILGGGIWWWWRRRRERRLFLQPNRISMLQRQPSGSSSAHSQWNASENKWNSPTNWAPGTWMQTPSATDLPRLPRDSDEGSVQVLESENGNHLVMSRQRRSLRVVNPDGLSANSTPMMDQGSTFDDEKAVPEGKTKNRGKGSRESSWSSNADPFSDKADNRMDFDFGI